MAKPSSQPSVPGNFPSPSVLLRTLVIVALGWWIYLPALHGGWIWDDLVYLPQNPLLNDPARLWKIWLVPGSFIEYYPIEQTVQWTQWELWQDDTFGYHVTNVILHLLSALLVWRLLGKLGLRLAWLGGLIFAIHPVMIESVAWISELKNALALPPFLLAMCTYLDYDNRRRKTDYFLALAWFLIAMLCKISMAPFPFIIILYAWWKRGRVAGSDLKSAAPFFVISLVLGLTTIFTGIWFRPLHHMPPDHAEIGGLLARLGLIGFLGPWYFAHSILPVNLSFFYPKEALEDHPLLPFIAWAVLAGVLYLLWSRRQSWGRHVLFGLSFFFINLAPFAGLTVPSYMRYTWAMDHFLYLPMIGLIGLAVAGLEQIDGKKTRAAHGAVIIVTALLVIIFATESRHYARTFASGEALWSHTVGADPLSPTAHNNYGSALVQKGQLGKAIAQFKIAAQLDSSDADARDNLGQAQAQMGNLADAMVAFDEAMRTKPEDASAYTNRGHLWQIMGKHDKALADLNWAIELNPGLVLPYLDRGVSRLCRADEDGALSDLRTYCQLAPNNPNDGYAHLFIWVARARQNQRADADRELIEALGSDGITSTEWTPTIARFLLRRVSEAELLAAMASPNENLEQNRQCDAWYFIGMVHLIDGDNILAMNDLKKSVDTGKTQSFSSILALGQLSLLESP